MDFVLQPWQFYVVILAGWINRQQQELIDYLRTEDQVVKELSGRSNILTTRVRSMHESPRPSSTVAVQNSTPKVDGPFQRIGRFVL